MQRQSDVVKAIHEHWVLTGVDVEQANGMADELADHLTAAVADGKDIDSVVGNDLRAFADDWAAPLVEPESVLDQVRLVIFATIAGAVCYVGAFALFEWNSEVTIEPVETGITAILMGLTASVVVGPSISRLGSGGGLRSNAFVALRVGVLFGIGMGTWIWFATTNEEAMAVTLPSWVVLPAAALLFVVVLFPLIVRLADVDQTGGNARRILRIVDKFL